jgi:predicted dehydrogenase
LKKKVGIIGCGAVTEQLYMKTLPLIQTVELKYLADKDIARAEGLASKANALATTDISELRKNSDIIMVCTPPESHYSLVKDSIAENKIIVCEKPFMPKASQVSELVELANKNNAKILVAHFRRIYPSVQLAKSLIKASNLGNLRSISVSEGGRFNWTAISDYFLTNHLGGVIFDTGSHAIDMALFIAGLDEKKLTIKNVAAKKDKAEPSHEVDAKILVEVEGVPLEIFINLSRYGALANQVVFNFEHGKITVPTNMSNFVKIGKGSHKTLVYSSNKMKDPGIAFYEQYKKILINNNADEFSAERFYNSISILEALTNA